MIDYVSPIPSVVQLLDSRLEEIAVVGNIFPAGQSLPAILIRSAGGNDYSRLQIISRAEDDITAEVNISKAINLLERCASQMQGLRVLSCIREGNPIPSKDEDTGHPEFWCYMRLNHLEA